MNQKVSKFDQIIQLQIKNNNLAHAYLVFGDFRPDTLLESRQIQSTDFFAVQESPIKISHVRELVSWLYLKPHSSPKRIAVLYHAELMTTEAANSLLKVLEEPPEYAILILQAMRKETILPTILSRCQIIRQQKSADENSLQDYISVEKIADMPVIDRFNLVNQIVEQKKVDQFINFWEKEIRRDLLHGRDTRRILENISHTRSLLLTNTSVKLLLENLVLKFEKLK